MKKTYLIAVLLAIAFSLTLASEPTRRIDPVDTLLTLTGLVAAPHFVLDSTILYFPGLNESARFAGFISVGFIPSGSDEKDSLSVWIKALVEVPYGRITVSDTVVNVSFVDQDGVDKNFMVSNRDSIIIADNIAWVSGDFYNTPITSPLGVCKGIIIYAKYTNIDGVGDAITLAPFATIQ